MNISVLTLENFGPFRDKVVMDMRPTKLKDDDGMVLDTGVGGEVLAAVSVFGANASGKSSVINALSILSSLVRFPRPANMPLPYNPFRLSPETRDAPSEIGISFSESDVVFDYTVSFTSSGITGETLSYYPEGRKVDVFSRKDGSFRIPAGKDRSDLLSLSRMVGENSTFVSVAAQFNNDLCRRVVDAFSKLLIMQGDMGGLLAETVKWMNVDPKFRDLLVKALTVADFGIDGLVGSVRERNIAELGGSIPSEIVNLMMSTGGSKVNEMDLKVRHSADVPGLDDSDLMFPYQIESNGTLRMIGIMGPVIHTLLNGGVVAIDEFGAFLDTDICRWILKLFAGDRNPKCAQLIVNTHNLLLMDTEDLFRRDQIFFVSKDRVTKSSDLYSLSDFSIRKNYDPLKGFRLGKFDERPRTLSERWFDVE